EIARDQIRVPRNAQWMFLLAGQTESRLCESPFREVEITGDPVRVAELRPDVREKARQHTRREALRGELRGGAPGQGRALARSPGVAMAVALRPGEPGFGALPDDEGRGLFGKGNGPGDFVPRLVVRGSQLLDVRLGEDGGAAEGKLVGAVDGFGRGVGGRNEAAGQGRALVAAAQEMADDLPPPLARE